MSYINSYLPPPPFFFIKSFNSAATGYVLGSSKFDKDLNVIQKQRKKWKFKVNYLVLKHDSKPAQFIVARTF